MSSTAKLLVAFVFANMPTPSYGLFSLPRQLRDIPLQVPCDRFANPLLSCRISHAVAAEQQLLVAQRQPSDLPAHDEALEEQLRAPVPGIVLGGCGGRGGLFELGDGPGAERFAQGQLVPVRIDVLDGRRL